MIQKLRYKNVRNVNFASRPGFTSGRSVFQFVFHGLLYVQVGCLPEPSERHFVAHREKGSAIPKIYCQEKNTSRKHRHPPEAVSRKRERLMVVKLFHKRKRQLARMTVGRNAPTKSQKGWMPSGPKNFDRIDCPAGFGALAMSVNPPPLTAPATTAY